jgi:hypothetical protein
MDSFSNPLLSSTRSHKNNTSEKIYSEAELDAPALITNGEDVLLAPSFLINNEGTDPNMIGRSGSGLTNLRLHPLAYPELFSSNPTIWNPSSINVCNFMLIPRVTCYFCAKPQMKNK